MATLAAAPRARRSHGTDTIVSTPGAASRAAGPLESRSRPSSCRQPCGATRESSPTWGRSSRVTSPHTGRSPNDKFVVREPDIERRRRLGQGQPAAVARAFRRCCSPTCGSTSTRARSCSCRTSTAAPIRRTGSRCATCRPNAWHMAFVRNMFIRPELSRPPDVRAELHGAARAGDAGRSGAPRHADRHVHRAQLRASARSSSAARATPASSRSRCSR